MKNVTIESVATITVPKRHWSHLLQALADFHGERFKPYATRFHTDTEKCPIPELFPAWARLRDGQRPAANHALYWLRDQHREHLSTFCGQLIFVCS